MRKSFFLRYSKSFLCLTLAATMLSVFILPSPAAAQFIRSSEMTSDELVGEDLSLLKAALEDKLILESLDQLGLSSHEVRERVDSLTPVERAAVLEQLDLIQAGGGSISMNWTTFLLILLLVIVLV